jgi:hypothetical protein
MRGVTLVVGLSFGGVASARSMAGNMLARDGVRTSELGACFGAIITAFWWRISDTPDR